MNKIINAYFYCTNSGKEPVREWLKSIDMNDKKVIGKDILKVELGWPVGMPLCRYLGKELYEVRSNISDGRIARILFFILGDKMILLHGFIKKTQKTPQKELDLAKKRMESFKNDT